MISGVTYARQGVILDTTGFTASMLVINLPAGFGISYSTSVRRLLASITAFNVPLDVALQPTLGPVSITPAALDAESSLRVARGSAGRL